MSIKCLMNYGLLVDYPCSPACALFGDCMTAFEAQGKAKPLTNADCIRALDDEELAEFLWTLTLEDIATDRTEGDTKYLSRNKLIEWLKQPATEDLRGDNDETTHT